MIENVKIGDIAGFITIIVALISGIGVISNNMKKWINKAMKEQMDNIDKQFSDLSSKLDVVDIESCKNFLVQFLSEVEKGQLIDEMEKQRFHEQYEHYLKMGGNSYIKSRIEKLQSKGWL